MNKAKRKDCFSSSRMRWIIIKTYSLSIFKHSRHTITPVNIWLCKLLLVIALILTCFTYHHRYQATERERESVEERARKRSELPMCNDIEWERAHKQACKYTLAQRLRTAIGVSVCSIGGSNHRLYRLWKSSSMKYIIASIYLRLGAVYCALQSSNFLRNCLPLAS